MKSPAAAQPKLAAWASMPSRQAAQPEAQTSEPGAGAAERGIEAADKEEPAPAYTLPPEVAAKAVAFAHAERALYFLNFGYQVIVLLLLLYFRIAPRYRDWAERASRNRFAQVLIFAPALLITLGVLNLPGDAASHWLERNFGQSIQGWSSWLGDQVKGGLVAILAGIFLIALLYLAIRRSPRRWWLYVWLASLPIMVFLTFVEPLVVEPLFFRYTPLASAHPELAAQLERVVMHAGERLPENRMFLMNASQKLNALNAYMTGVGASRRIVVWDTTISRMTMPEILFVFGHEMGHYVLGHIVQGMIFAAGLMWLAFFLGFHVLRWVVRRYGRAWNIRGEGDWASLVVLLLFFLLFDFAVTPASNAFSRHLEHQADQYGLEVIHGIVPNAPLVAAQSFQILGEVDLEEPSPSRLTVFWFYTHPPIADRMRFAESYDPWKSGGESPRYVK